MKNKAFDFMGWMAFLFSTIVEEISTKTEALGANTCSLSSAWNRGKYKNDFNIGNWIAYLH